MYFRELVFKKTKVEKEVVSSLFFDERMTLLLPSSMDIYLTGGKSHDSEIRLARFMIHTLNRGDVFLDIGAHYGYFTLLGARLVGEQGQVLAIEAAPKTYAVLEKNKAKSSNIETLNRAVSDEKTSLTFYEFPNQYSEYNTLDIAQFENEPWFNDNLPTAITVDSIVLDDLVSDLKINPKLIKMDVEGAEYQALNGFKKHLERHSPIVVMEYVSDQRGNNAHREAERLMESLGYKTFRLNKEGRCESIKNIPNYLDTEGLESDNIVFQKYGSTI